MRVKNLTKIYKTNAEQVLALDNMTLEFPEKGMVFIVGVSGSGKSTLMNILSGVDYPTSGEVFIGEKSLYEISNKDMSGYRNSYVGFVFQDYNLIEDLDVYENIKLPLEFLEIKDSSIIDEVIKKVDIEDIKHSKVSEISSGQMQRVAIARCLVKNSQIILADEPTGNLDSKNTVIVMDMLKEISKDRLVIVITHDDESAEKYGDAIISLEDGKMIGYKEAETLEKAPETQTETPEFKKPKITFLKQLQFTLGFMRNNIARSIAILIIMILLPIVGNIMAGYAFFNVGDSYGVHQDKYGSEYVSMSKNGGNLEYYYSKEEVDEMYNKYPEADFIKKYSTHIDLNIFEKEEHGFFRPIVSNILVKDDFENYYGTLPEIGTREVLITDYLFEAYKYYQEVGSYDEIVVNLDGVDCTVTGIIETSYEDFMLDGDDESDFRKMALEENYEYYNAVMTTPTCYERIFEHMEGFYDNINFSKKVEEKDESGKVIKTSYQTTYDQILISTERKIININYNISGYGSSDYYIAVSTAFLKDFSGEGNYQSTYSRVIFTGYSKSKIKLAYHIGAVFESDVKEVILPFTEFEVLKENLKECRLMISRNDKEYRDIVSNESVINPSYVYAKAMGDKASETKISMIQFLISLVVILIVFASIVNSMTVASEKKKIGIKYSFGINKGPIIIPYILELVIYIIIGLIVSIAFVKGGIYEAFLRQFVYTTEEQLREFSFFRIGFDVIFGWDLIIYSIMVGSLAIMILNICRKSPIEIIKDL